MTQVAVQTETDVPPPAHLTCVKCNLFVGLHGVDHCSRCGTSIAISAAADRVSNGVNLWRLRRAAGPLFAGFLLVACSYFVDAFAGDPRQQAMWWVGIRVAALAIIAWGAENLTKCRESRITLTRMVLFACASILIGIDAALAPPPWVTRGPLIVGATVEETWMVTAYFSMSLVAELCLLVFSYVAFGFMRDMWQRLGMRAGPALSAGVFGMGAMVALWGAAAAVLRIILQWQRFPIFAPPAGGGMAAGIWTSPVYGVLDRYIPMIASVGMAAYFLAVAIRATALRRRYMREAEEGFAAAV